MQIGTTKTLFTLEICLINILLSTISIPLYFFSQDPHYGQKRFMQQAYDMNSSNLKYIYRFLFKMIFYYYLHCQYESSEFTAFVTDSCVPYVTQLKLRNGKVRRSGNHVCDDENLFIAENWKMRLLSPQKLVIHSSMDKCNRR